MKKLHILIIIVLIIGIIFLIFMPRKCEKVTVPNAKNIAEERSIDVLSEMSISESNIGDKKVVISMDKGSYKENFTELGAQIDFGKVYTGSFRLKYLKEDYSDIHSVYLNDIFKESSLKFNSLFSLTFEDYNGDGNDDFAVGQYFNSSSFYYRIFSVIEDKIVELPLEDGYFKASVSEEVFSPGFEAADKGFVCQVYSQDKGYVDKKYIWDNDKFILE